MKLFIIAIITATIFINCTPQNPNSNNSSSNCNFPLYNNKFSQLIGGSSYNQVKTLFGLEGDNYRNDQGGLRYYHWYPCDDRSYFVDCWFLNDNLYLANKNFSNNTCSNNISNQSFQSITTGMSYQQVSGILNNEGDNFRIDYSGSNPLRKYYSFYNCSDTSKRIDVWFSNNLVFLSTKNF